MVVLEGRRCGSCGYLFFPPQDYGCERCGATDRHLTGIELASRGSLRSSVTVHRQQDQRVKVPFAVGVILLDDGPAVTGILDSDTDDDLRIGDRMSVVLAPRDNGRASSFELRFAKVGATTP